MKSFKSWLALSISLLICVTLIYSFARAAQNPGAPPELDRWRAWVLYGKQHQLCPRDFDNAAVTRCQWPSRLTLVADSQGARFAQQWRLFAPGWVRLPGAKRLWPEAVQVNGKTEPVLERNGFPAVFLEAGSFQITGRFTWDRIPELMKVPPQLGLVNLVVAGQVVSQPVIDGQHNLWIRKKAPAGQKEPAGMQVYIVRLIRDTIPMRIITLFNLDVSGSARKVLLEPVLPAKAIVMSIKSALPARLNQDGRLQIQLRPGSWQIRLEARMPGPVSRLAPPGLPYGDEVWAFEAQRRLRSVKVAGAALVEPSRTRLPSEWQRFPAYLITKDSALVFKQLRRGAASLAEDRLELERHWWLDFDGQGFTVCDRIEGRLGRQWFLAMDPPARLGRVAVDGKDRLITAHGPEGKAGVELRQGRLKLEADARLEGRLLRQPVTWWDHDFSHVKGWLHLPPGWRLVATAGVDDPPPSWLNSWNLLAFFIVLIVTLAVFKVCGPAMGTLALVTMILVYHEPAAPRLVWLHLLVALAVKRKVRAGFLNRVARLWLAGALCVLAVQSVLFTVDQLKTGFFPQLARPATNDGFRPPKSLSVGQVANEALMARPAAMPARGKDKLGGYGQQMSKHKKSSSLLDEYDPDALIQTGPGLPDWQWQTLPLKWNGPVTSKQVLHLYLLSPALNLVLALVRVACLALMIWGVVKPDKAWSKFQKATALGVVALMIMVLSPPTRAAEADVSAGQGNGFPPLYLLREFEKRLLQPPDCLPRCADLSRMDVTLRGRKLQVLLQVHAAVETAIPLPAGRRQWMPQQVLADGARLEALGCDDKGRLWAAVAPGRHTITLLAEVGGLDTIRLPLPLKPHFTTVTAPGWKIEGLQAGGQAADALILHRPGGKQTGQAKEKERAGLIPFFSVTRHLQLGLSWKIRTTVERLTPSGQPVVLKIPLLAGESVTTGGIAVEGQVALVRLGPSQRRAFFVSTLAKAVELELKAPAAVPWTETWLLDASPIWHCSFDGLTPVQHQDASGIWRPLWKPWPGEKVTIHLSRPRALPGKTVTIDQAGVQLRPSSRFLEAEMKLTLRSSKGGQYSLELPPGALLQLLEKNGRLQPLTQDGKLVLIPLEPGPQKVRLVWRQPHQWKLIWRGPQVTLAQEAVNARVVLHVPENRWILWLSGPRLGPVVLFWSYLGACLLVAFFLARTGLTILGIGQWILLAIGLAQVPVPAGALVAVWLLALGVRRRSYPSRGTLQFDLIQVALVGLTLAALGVLYWAIMQGLMAPPEMQIAGNDSSPYLLKWYQDRIAGSLPMPVVVSLPRWTYQALVLLWSLWLVAALVKWLAWGWECFGSGGMWRKPNWRLRRKKPDSSKTKETSGGS